MKKLGVILPAAGMGKRLDAGKPKAFVKYDGIPLFMHALQTFLSLDYVSEVILAFPFEEIDSARSLLFPLQRQWKKPITVVNGGKERQDSVRHALKKITAPYVAVHDAARPFVTSEIIDAVYNKAVETGAAIAATKATDTIKFGKDFVHNTIDRDLIWLAQTPQIFKTSILIEANQKADEEKWDVTDDASMVEMCGKKVTFVPSSPANKKITYKSDMVDIQENHKPILPRIGYGYDVHRLMEGRKLIIGGVHIPFKLGLFGHSDADVLLHAITDAILGAASLGDIGKHFPDTDPQYRNVDSRILLQKTVDLLSSEGFVVGNVDATIVAESPKMLPHIEEMRTNIAADLKIAKNNVSVKATTSEKMGFVGKSQGIASHAVAIIYSKY